MQAKVPLITYKAHQKRSQQTLERLLNATIELLHDRPFDDITVADIVTHAASSVGAFYKRFSSKQAMLPSLLEKVQQQQLSLLDDYLDEQDWHGQNLHQRLSAFVQLSIESYRTNHWLVQTLLSKQFSPQNEVNDQNTAYAKSTIERLTEWLLNCRQEIKHPQPDIAMPIAIGSLVLNLQACYVFDMHYIDVDKQVYPDELIHAFLAYIGTKETPHHA